MIDTLCVQGMTRSEDLPEEGAGSLIPTLHRWTLLKLFDLQESLAGYSFILKYPPQLLMISRTQLCLLKQPYGGFLILTERFSLTFLKPEILKRKIESMVV